MAGADCQTGSSARPSIVGGAAARVAGTAVALVDDVGGAGVADSAWRNSRTAGSAVTFGRLRVDYRVGQTNRPDGLITQAIELSLQRVESTLAPQATHPADGRVAATGRRSTQRRAGHVACFAWRVTLTRRAPLSRDPGRQGLGHSPASGRRALYSVAHTIEQLARRLPLALVGPAAGARLRTVAASLPAALTNWVYLECRLRGDASRVDLIVRVDERGRDILTGDNPIFVLDAALHAHPIWRGVRALALAWSEESSPLHRGIERIWLEFDVHALEGSHVVSEMPAPGVFIEFAREAYAQHSREERFRVAMSSLMPLLQGGIEPAIVRNLRRCWDLLPAGVSIPYVGLFESRGSSAVRVCVAGLGDADLPAYLRALRWPGSHRQLATAIGATLPPPRAPRPRMAIVNLDIDTEISSNIGIEYLLNNAAQFHGGILETEFLDHLVESGLASSAKCDALLTWPTTSLETMRHELWRSRVARRVNHVKLACTGDEMPEVKGYLSMSHDFRPALSPSERATIRMHPSTR